MRHLGRLDRLLLAVVVPLWVLCFVLHLGNIDTGYAQSLVVTTGAPEPGGHPVVLDVRRGLSDTPPRTIRPGDRLERIGGHDLAGAGPLDVFAHVQRAIRSQETPTATVLRDGERFEAPVPLERMPLPLRYHLVSLSAIGTALAILLRAPRSRAARAVFHALVVLAFGFLRYWGGPVAQTWFWIGTETVAGALIGPTLVLAALAFPDDAERAERRRLWPWLFAPAGVLFLAGVVGFPLLGSSGSVITAAMLALNTLGIALLVIFWQNYRRSDALGRRKMRWVVLAFFLCVSPVVAITFFAIANPDWWWLASAAEILYVLIPISILVAMARTNLFDVDRLLSVTATYSVLLVGLVALALVLVPSLAQAAAQAVGLDPRTGQLVLSLAIAAVAVPSQRALRPRIERWFFPERHALTTGIHSLLEDVGHMRSPEQLTREVAGRIDELLRPESCVVYARSGEDAFEAIFARGRAVPPAFEARHPLVASLAGRSEPLVSEHFAERAARGPSRPIDRALLEGFEVAVVAPVRRRGALFAFLCLGPKRSGDVYTSTDLSLLTAATAGAATRIERFDDADLLEQGRTMREALRRYVPRAVADELDARGQVSSGERDATVLFVDIRGYTRFSETRAPSEIFEMLNRYTEVVSDVVRRHGGSVVEFNGDGMMAVFGASGGLPDKERAALRAALEICERMDVFSEDATEPGEVPLSVGVGIATGPVFVGSIRAVDRSIWTAVGNTTNLAARLESLTRELAAAVVIDGTTAERAASLAGDFEKRPAVPIRGRSERQDLWVLPLRPMPD